MILPQSCFFTPLAEKMRQSTNAKPHHTATNNPHTSIAPKANTQNKMPRWNSASCTHQLPLGSLLLLLLVLLLVACLAAASPSSSSASSPSVVPGHVRRSGKGFVWDCTGNCEHNAVTKTTPGAVLMVLVPSPSAPPVLNMRL